MGLFARRARGTDADEVAEGEAQISGGGAPREVGAAARVPVVRPPVDVGLVLNGRYEIGRPLGSGGMATVHLARDLLLGREVAVKLFRRDGLQRPDHRLQEIEARVTASLNHYALTTLLDAGVDGSDAAAPQIYLVMEYVRGATLKQRQRGGPMEVSEACWLGFDLAEGLDHMHQAGFLHRDVKPANILISSQRSVRPVVAKLTDFGIAAPVGQPDLSEYTVGSAAYLSPEQVEGLDARPESDVYSLGLVLLEAVTGRVAFPGTVEVSAFARLERDPAIPNEVPAQVADLLSRMTARDPNDRVSLYQVAVELQQFLVDDLLRRRGDEAPSQPSVAKPATTSEDSLVHALGTHADAVLDRFVRLAARALAVPYALLLLEEAGQAWVKAQHGWGPGTPGLALPSTSAFPPSNPQVWVLADIDAHQLDRVHPLLSKANGARAAAGVPLLTRDGRRAGSLIVSTDAPRVFQPDDLVTLADVAELIVHEIELRAAARRALLGNEIK